MKFIKIHEAVRLHTLAVLLTIVTFQIQAQPNFSITGFATQNGGTTGGQGGSTVTVNNYNDLKSYAESTSTYIIMVEGTITNGSGGGQIQVKSNKSIIGVGSNALLQGVGIDISSQNNVIIQNLKVTLAGTSTPTSVNGGDCISISGTSKNIWIDHCEMYSEDPDVQTDINKYDGLIDIKGQTGFITISWCYLHDHHKGCLVGASDSDLYADRKVTYHHNYFDKVKLRVPMYRGSTGHFFNNYIVDAQDATEIREGTCVRVEKNYYEPLHYSIYTPSDSPGYTERIDNVEVSRASRAYPGNCTASIPYNYSNFLTSNTNDVKTLVPQYAGVGVIGQSNDPVDAFSTIEAEDYSAQTGIQTETCSEGGLDVGYINNGDYLVFNDVDFGSVGASQFVARAATNGSGGTVRVRLDGTSGTLIGSLTISGTGGWQTYSDFTANVSQVSGVHDLYLVFEGGSGYLFNLNYFYFNEVSVSGPSITVQENSTGFCDVDGTIDSDNSGFTGPGYANTSNGVGVGVDYKVSFSSAGSYQFEIRYASNSSRPARLLVNGQEVVSNIDFPSTGDWSTFATVSAIASVGAGTYDVRLEATGSSGLGNIDYMKVTGNTPSAASCSSTSPSILTIQENTTGFCGVDGTVDSDNAGYTGSGFANATNALGQGIDWEVSVPSTGSYSLVWRYANGSGSDRDGAVIVNSSTQVSSVSMNGTGSWTTWTETPGVNVTLSSGTNTIRLEANTSSGLANIDYLEITGIDPTAENCSSGSRLATLKKQVVGSSSICFYPNPVEEMLHLTFLKDNAARKDLRIYNLAGHLIKQMVFEGDEGQINVGDLKQGIYFVEVDGIGQGRFIKK